MSGQTVPTILVVEDEEKICSLVELLLKRMGYEVLKATNGGQALALSDDHQGAIDLLLTDVMMPDMTGIELSERLIAKRPGLPVLYMSAYTDSNLVRAAVLGTGRGFLPKPFRPEELKQKVRDLIGAPATD